MRADPLVPPACRQLPGAGPETGGKPWDPMGISDMCPYGSSQYEWMRTAEVGAAAALQPVELAEAVCSAEAVRCAPP